MDLPHALYPTDRVLIDAPMVPPDALRCDGPMEGDDRADRADGTPIPADRNVVVDVSAARPLTAAIHSTTRAL